MTSSRKIRKRTYIPWNDVKKNEDKLFIIIIMIIIQPGKIQITFQFRILFRAA